MNSRLFDALFNRSREALRTLEDHVRFVQDNSSLQSACKELRHQISLVERRVFKKASRTRNVAADVGQGKKTPSSSRRQSAQDIVDAAFCRLQESLRSLEEHLKIDFAREARMIEACRYQAYSLQEQFSRSRPRQWQVYALITQSLSYHPLEKLVPQLLKGGVSAIQIREKNMSDKKLLSLCRKVKKLCEGQNVQLILNDRPDLAVTAGFDGVHVGQGDITPKDIKKLFGSKLFVGLSTHSEKQAHDALRQGADYIGIGPVFATQTKPHLKFIGTTNVRKMVQASKGMPHVCIGGIDMGNTHQIVKAGGQGVALCTGLIQAKSPQKVCRQILRGIK